MPFPTVITASFAYSLVGSSSPGPIEVGGAIYVFAGGAGSPNFLTAFKSTDGAQTWTPVVSTSDNISALSIFNCILVGTTIYCLCLSVNATPHTVFVIPFDTTTDTFGAHVDTGRTAQSGLGINTVSSMAACYRPSDNSIIVCSYESNLPLPLRTFYFVFDLGTMTAGAQIACGETGADPNSWQCMYAVHANGFTQFFFVSTDFAGFNAIHVQALSDGGTLGAVQTLDSSVVANNASFFAAVNGTVIVVGWTPDGTTVKSFSGVSADPAVLTEHDATYPGTTSGFPSFAAVRASDGKNYIFVTNNPSTGYFVDLGSGFGAFVPLSTPFDSNAYAAPLTSFLWGFIATDSGGTINFYALLAPPPPPPVAAPKATAGGGTYFPRFVNKTLLHAQIARVVGPTPSQIFAYREFAPLYWLYDFPNGNDLCLSREWRLYNQIDRRALSCARKPDCFSGEEGARSWVEAPPGAVTFNPDKAIPLPDPAAVDVVILSFRVPIGYDGIVLAQYHAYRGQGTFVEASGDIVWRVRVNGRYLRDMGNMQLSLGSPQTLSPCPGGLWLYSGNLVEYVVSAPNGSGFLPLPGQGNILAGLHGWYWPRI